ncbi:small ribosomal subunit protein mS34-like [Ptychodera flava]|uniref:small ribosomal subunit protein mS34-like n=1 Tax=Ptychodera flava TaxID=63121 RepID=UPI00396A7BE3
MSRKISNLRHLVSNLSPFNRKEIFEKFFFTGKNLFNICTECHRLGVGRVVTRRRWNLLYPEPSYYVITRVRIDCGRPNLDGGRIWGKLTWRGYPQDGEVMIGAAAKKEWSLVRKSEEKEFCHYNADPIKDFSLAPSETDMPPLLKAMVIQQRQKLGVSTDEEPKLKVKVRKGTRYRVLQAEDIEELQQRSVVQTS